MWWTFPTLNITLFLFYDFNVIYFLTNRTCVRNRLRDFSITRVHKLITKCHKLRSYQKCIPREHGVFLCVCNLMMNRELLTVWWHAILSIRAIFTQESQAISGSGNNFFIVI
jgi:hypothetical protein